VEASGRAGQLWREVAKAATLAQHDWYQALPASRPSGEAAWSEAADVATVAEVIVEGIKHLPAHPAPAYTLTRKALFTKGTTDPRLRFGGR
jgi:hypothetical protein